MRTIALLSCTILLASACRTKDPDIDTANPSGTCTWYADRDGDGYGDVDSPATGDCADDPSGYVDNDLDCDDDDPAVNPDGAELCNGIDDDCDGQADEDASDAGTFYLDGDGDGYGNPSGSVVACQAPDGFVVDDQDCDDDDPETHPDAPERCDGEDNDCDGEIDEDLQELWFADADGDGFGNPEQELESCDPGAGWVADASDCDDTNSSVNPAAEEVCNEIDDDCDGEIDEDLAVSWYQDADSDGFGDPDVEVLDCDPGTGWVENLEDCDDANSAIHPDAQELCNGYDDDCDGLVDDQDDSITGLVSWYLDADADGYGDDASVIEACELPSGYAEYGGDCDDSDPAYNPGASESDCTDPADYNCDGSTGYTDDDGDGWAACEDCDDADAAVNADAEELCDNVDNDCDGDIDEDDAGDAATWYLDADGDGYGDLSSTTAACDQPSGYVSLAYATDCDDSDATVSPVAAESCDGVDEDCDGDIDEGVTDTWYADVDGDGYGDATSTTEACSLPSGYVADDTDCDDADAAVNPGASELCDGVDNDCDGSTDEPDADDAATWYRDGDSDGYGNVTAATISCEQPSGYVADATDCDDGDDDVHPGADEHCDGIDEDCDGDVDEASVDADTWYADADGDSYGDAGSTVEACTQPSGYVSDDTDCDDGDAAINPAATEICDGLDNDCDGLVDDDDSAVSGTTTWYVDYDGDGYGGARLSVDACVQPSAYVDNFSDCDDADASAYPGGTEVCDGADNDCDGTVDEDDATDVATWYADSDGDGYGDASVSDIGCDAPSGYVADASDCDDSDAAVNPDAQETCDGIDNDCDGAADDDDDDYVGAGTWYADSDGDGYGDATSTTEACAVPSGYVADASDCDDGDGAINPAATEICDGIDNDCDGLVDDDDTSVSGTTTWYVDYDGDGYGGARLSTTACVQPSAYVDNFSDCDDADASAHPGADEVCDGADNDCDGTVDEDDATDASTFYADADGDGYGDAGSTYDACSAPSGYVADASDCDDGDVAVNPGASELCDGIDNDCDGLVDGDDGDVTDTATWYADSDADGYGDSASTTTACSAPSGYVADASDCDDADAALNPGATEICDGIDNDCDGLVDDDDTSVSGTTTWYVDYDGDGYGGLRLTQRACDQPSSYVDNADDCDDGDAAAYPGADELCDGADNDCDGTVDEDDAIDGATFYADGDGDGYGDATSTTTACSAPSGYTADATDCDDSDAALNPGAAEICDGIDNDCDGLVDDDDDDLSAGTTWYIDADGDGYGSTSYSVAACSAPSGYVADNTDCDDLAASSYPGADELCDGDDNDCDGTVDEDEAIDADTWYADADSDGYGDAGSTYDACAAPSGYVADDTDCDDSDGGINPGAAEICNGVDDDCDGDSDNGVRGSDSTCAAESCLEVLEDGSPTGSDWFWLEDSSGTAYEEYCDFGTVGSGWAYRVELEIENTTGTTVYDHQVEVVLDSASLITAGKLEGDAADLRFFTHDGPLMDYWLETMTVDSTTTSVWVTVPTLAASSTTEFTLTYGNPVTERKSFCWHYDSFDASSTAWYDTQYDSSWGTPSFSWSTSSGTLDTDSSNQDYFLQLSDGLVEFDSPVYVETYAIEYDDDTIGPMLRDSSGSFITASGSNDYDGVAHAGGQEAIVEHSTVPSAHYVGSYLLELGNITSVSSLVRIGLYWDGSELAYYLSGSQQGSVADSLDIVGAGLSSFASSGSPGASFDYLWVGSTPIDFNPTTIASDGLASVGSESAF
jgi:large repetitive protein